MTASTSSSSSEFETSSLTPTQRFEYAVTHPTNQEEKSLIRKYKFMSWGYLLMLFPLGTFLLRATTVPSTIYNPTFLRGSVMKFRPYKSVGFIGNVMAMFLSAMVVVSISEVVTTVKKLPAYAGLNSELGEATRLYLKEHHPKYYDKIVQPQFLERDAEKSEIL